MTPAVRGEAGAGGRVITIGAQGENAPAWRSQVDRMHAVARECPDIRGVGGGDGDQVVAGTTGRQVAYLVDIDVVVGGSATAQDALHA